MIIDADTHITPTDEGISSEELIEMIDNSDVDKTLTWIQPPYMRKISKSNQYLYQAAKKYSDKIIGFGWADPNLGVENAKDMVKKCIYEYGFHGVKLNGAQNNFYVDDPKISLPVIEEIAKTGKAIAFHVGVDAYEHTHPFRIAKIAKMYPDMKILIVHMGGVGMPDMSKAVIEVAEEHSNIYLIGSKISPIPILNAVKTLGADRVCFGSDTPFEFMHVELAKYRALLDREVSEDDKAKILGGNISRILGLE